MTAVEAMVLALYATAGVATFVGFVIWTMAQLPVRPDWVDGMFATILGVAAGVVWPLAWVAVAVMVFGRRVWESSQSPD